MWVVQPPRLARGAPTFTTWKEVQTGLSNQGKPLHQDTSRSSKTGNEASGDAAAPPQKLSLRDPAALRREFNLSYHVDSLLRLNDLVPLSGLRVLEVGGALPPGLVNDVFGTKTWLSVDDRSAYLSSMAGSHSRREASAVQGLDPEALNAPWMALDGRAHDIPASADGHFDLVVSLATLEHVSALPLLLRRMAALLRPGGSAWCLVGPIWSGYRGHHVYPDYFAPHRDKTAALLREMQPWQHLWMSSMEFYKWLDAGWGAEFADIVHYNIFESSRLNRLFYPDYEIAFTLSGLKTAFFRPWPMQPANLRNLDVVQARFPQSQGFQIDGFEILLSREPSCAE